MKKHFSIRITGRVQGVFFRGSTLDQAKALGLTGFVRNEPDGSVYIEAEGEEHVLAEFLAWCQKGPPAAKVQHCQTEELPLKHFTKFEIQRF